MAMKENGNGDDFDDQAEEKMIDENDDEDQLDGTQPTPDSTTHQSLDVEEAAQDQVEEEALLPALSPIEGELLSGVKKGRGMQMFDTSGFMYKPTKHEKRANIKRYKCIAADGGEFNSECKVTLTTTYIGNIVLRVSGGFHNHQSQQDVVDVMLLEDKERKNNVHNRHRLGGREMWDNICRKVKTDAQMKLVSTVRSLGKKVAYDRKKLNKFPAELELELEVVLLDEEEDPLAL